jgi:hypothetical protein
MRVPAPEGSVLLAPTPVDVVTIAEARGDRRVA